jgi:hypothetical protein
MLSNAIIWMKFCQNENLKIQKISNFEIFEIAKSERKKKKEKALDMSAFPYTQNTHFPF